MTVVIIRCTHYLSSRWLRPALQLILKTAQPTDYSFRLLPVRLRVVPHFSSGMVERAKRERE